MKHPISAAVALGLALGLAAAAQAHGLNRQSAAEPAQFQSAPAMNQQMSRNQIIQLQRQLKAEGLYRGKANGVMNKATRLAMARSGQRLGSRQTALAQSHQRAGLRQTAMLKSRHHQPQRQTTMTGSSSPTVLKGEQNNLNTNPAAPPAPPAPNAGSTTQK